MTVEDLLSDNGITLASTAPGRHYATCPQCSALRSRGNQSAKVLGVTIDNKGVRWGCNHCGWSGPEKGNGKAHGYGASAETYYDYCDAEGVVRFRKVRKPTKDGKTFWVESPDGKGGWIKGAKGVDTKLLYRLPEIIKAIAAGQEIAIAEGEKDCDRIWRIGIPATCNVGGASDPDQQPKWYREHSEQLRGANIIVFNDNDPPGHAHADAIVKASFGIADRIRRLDLAPHWPDMPKGADVSDWLALGHGREELDELIANAETIANPKADAPAAGLDEWDAGDEPGTIPPRQWLLANQFCIGFISSIVAAGGTGKSALRLLQYISLALGRPLSGQHVFRRSRVLLISLEDDRNELQRRIAAVLIHYKIDRRELKGWLFCSTPKRSKLAVSMNGARAVGPLERHIREAIDRRDPAIVGVDPFIKTHGLEENSVSDMDFVCDLLATICVDYNVSVDSPHHTHKGIITPGDADSGRGSSGIRDAGRLVSTLTPMSSDEAKTYAINPDDRYSFVRLDNAKVNIAVRSGKPTWFRLIGVPIGNRTDEYPNGDTVQVVEPWSPPDAWAGIGSDALNAALSEIERGATDDDGKPTGGRYSSAASAKDRAAWPVVQRFCPDRTEAQCREIIKTWEANGVIFTKEYYDPEQRRDRKGLYVNDAKRPGSKTAS